VATSKTETPHRDRVLIDFALQGGGAHGAFTWGALDRLLEEPWLQIDGISGTSAGAMNAAVLVDGYAKGGADAARSALEGFWRSVSRTALLSPLRRGFLDILLDRWSLDHSPVFVAMDMMARVFSPYDLNPGGFNPLQQILADCIDFERLGRAPIKLFVTATNVRTGHVVLAGALVTYGGVSLFVAFFVLVPMAQELFRTAGIPNRSIPAAITLGTSTFTMSALPGTPAIQNAIPIPFFGTTPLAAPGLGIIGSAIMLAFGLWWLGRATARPSGAGHGWSPAVTVEQAVEDETIRQRATTAREFDPPEVRRGQQSRVAPPTVLAGLPLLVVVSVNVLMTLVVLPRLDVSFLAEERFGATSLSASAACGRW
jgi:hypothetical protein